MDIDSVQSTYPGSTCKISTTCDVSVLWNDVKCKEIFSVLRKIQIFHKTIVVDAATQIIAPLKFEIG